ncbi:MAG: hypothetical protein NVS3B26_17250 [Mycobacteriales bacterium]
MQLVVRGGVSERGGVSGRHFRVLVMTDIVDSTVRVDEVGDARWAMLLAEHRQALRRVVATRGGEYLGHSGDGVLVSFLSPGTALRCAWELVEQAQALDLPVRVGVHAGEVETVEDGVGGVAVHVTARVMGCASAGQVIVSAAVVPLVAGGDLSFDDVGEQALKGLAGPWRLWQLLAPPVQGELIDDAVGLGDEPAAQDNALPLPARLAHPPAVGVVGRERELAALDKAAKRALAGEGRELIFLAGEPGQGKTTLVAEIARRAHKDGATVLLGRCDEELGTPYRPFCEALSHYVAHAPKSLLSAHVAVHGSELVGLVPALGHRLGGLPPRQSDDGDTERYLLFAAVVGLLEAACAEHPVVVVLDDVHWADKPSLQLLRHLLSNTSSARLLILGTYRDVALSASHPLTETLAALHREPDGVTTSNVRGLDDAAVRAIFESNVGHELDGNGVALAQAVQRETDGNAFFVGELLRHLTESGAIYQDASGRWAAAGGAGFGLPHSVRAVIGARVARLGTNASKALAAASVIGREFDLDLLAGATGVGEDELIDLMEAAERAAVVHEVRGSPGRYGFAHALVQHTLYEDIGSTRRTRLHALVGEAIEHLYAGHLDNRVGELARHFLLANRASDAYKAIAYARRAGDRSIAVLAPDEAVRYFTQGIELASRTDAADPTLQIDLLIGLGTAQRQAGIPAFRQTLLEASRAARAEGDAVRLAAAALANSRGMFTSLGQSDEEKVEILEAALAALPEADSGPRARVLATLCSELVYVAPLERRLALADAAKGIANRLGDPAAFADVVSRCAVSLNVPTTLERELVDVGAAIEAAEALNDLPRLFLAAWIGSFLAVRAGMFALAEERASTVDELAARCPQPSFVWTAAYTSAARALLRGDAVLAEQLALTAHEVGSASGQPDALEFYGGQLLMARYMSGQMGELIPLLQDTAANYPNMAVYPAALALAHLENGNETTAALMTEEAADTSFDFAINTAWADALACYARVIIELELHEPAAILFGIISPFADQIPFEGLVPHEPFAAHLGGLTTVLGRYDEAERYFAAAADINERGSMDFAAAQTTLWWGRLARKQGDDPHRARALFEAARTSAVEHGYHAIERRAAAELSMLD